MFGIGLLASLLIGGLLLLLPTAVGRAVARSPLRRSTVERFAARQRLDVTDGNAAHVVGALLITHRWRRAGLVLGLAVGLVWSLPTGSLTLYFLAGFLGWFVGAVIAEWRISRLDSPGTRRVAALAPRSLRLYLTPVVQGLAAVTGAGLLMLLVAALVRGGVSAAWVGWLAYSAALGTVLWLTARAVVARPSGFVDPDLREADDALRCHGLTVLAGSAIAASYPALSALVMLAAYPDGVPTSADPEWSSLILLLALALGFWVAVWSASARAAREIPAGPPLDQGVETSEEEAASP